MDKVGIVSIDIGRSWVRIQAEPSDFSLLWIVHTSCGALPASFLLGTRSCFLGVKQLDHDFDHTPPSIGKIEWNYIFTPPTCIHVMARASSYLPVVTFLLEVFLLVSLWHIQSSTTKALRRPSESLRCKSFEIWRCVLGRIVHHLEGFKCSLFRKEQSKNPKINSSSGPSWPVMGAPLPYLYH